MSAAHRRAQHVLATDDTQVAIESQATPSPNTAQHPAGSGGATGATNSGDQQPDQVKPPPPPLIPGWAWLLLVAMLWGTYAPTLRLIYAQPEPPSPASLLFVRTIVCAGTLMLVDAVRRPLQQQQQQQGSPRTPARHSSMLMPKPSPAEHHGTNPVTSMLNETLPIMWMGGVELGVLKFAGEATQALGLQHTTAVRGAFLIQATSLCTPLIAAAAGDRLRRVVLGAAVVAAAGAVLMTTPGDGAMMMAMSTTASSSSSSSTMPLNSGDSLILLAAFFYSLSTFRLSKYAERFTDHVRFAAWKTVAGTIVAAVWVVTDQGGMGFTQGWSTSTWVGTVWLALGPGALATYAQLAGQRALPASESQVLYSSTPLWSAVLSAVLLDEGGFGSPLEFVGGVLIVVAGVVAAVGGRIGGGRRGGSV